MTTDAQPGPRHLADGRQLSSWPLALAVAALVFLGGWVAGVAGFADYWEGGMSPTLIRDRVPSVCLHAADHGDTAIAYLAADERGLPLRRELEAFNAASKACRNADQ